MKRFFLLLLMSSFIWQAKAQKMRDVFAHMPDTVLNLLTEYNRLDCIDFIENDREAKVRNRLDGFSILQRLTDNYLRLQLTASTQVEMKLLSGKDSLEYIVLAKTYAAPAKSSIVSFYTLDWQKLPASSFLKTPDFDAFWKQPLPTDKAEADSVLSLKKKMDLRPLVASLSENDESLTFTLQPANLEKEDSIRVSKRIEPVVYQWNRNQFIPLKTQE
ncbi:MAG: DUF3256 family protein [Candidatus Paraprevotella stercoravium]|uniref:DUF3256 family protein n=1 Tax=Candidatus Paraprevotella stercoravium TaxID=2838725 RepID=A0A9E2P163_9BACT|nr:DUF3256 family protein [Candidatus Paraprevotella stercoravium]